MGCWHDMVLVKSNSALNLLVAAQNDISFGAEIEKILLMVQLCCSRLAAV